MRKKEAFLVLPRRLLVAGFFYSRITITQIELHNMLLLWYFSPLLDFSKLDCCIAYYLYCNFGFFNPLLNFSKTGLLHSFLTSTAMAKAKQHSMLLLFLLLAESSWQTACAIQLNYPEFSITIDFTISESISNGSAIWLTYDTTAWQAHPSYSHGWFVYTDPVQFMDDDGHVASFKTSFTFQIITTGENSSGDGMAFFISANRSAPENSTGGCLGLVNGGCHPSHDPDQSASLPQPSRHLFAVEFDTFQNPEVQDPSGSHVGIDINSLNSTATNDTHRNPELSLYRNYTFTAWVEYNASSFLIQVWMTNSTSKPRPVDPILSSYYNLSSVFVKYMYVGFSASTGNLYEGHILYSWSFSTFGLQIGSRKSRLGLTLGLGLFVSVITCVAVVSIAQYRRTVASSHERYDHNIDSTLHRYSYRELSRATQSFSNARLLGEGAFSRVYKGIMRDPERSMVAVKRLNEGLGNKAAFRSEIRIISNIRHRNLLQLRGWCHEKGKALLVYDYMPNGSLDRYLFSRSTEPTLRSETRFNILLGVAAALQYLHEGLGECVLHRDVKAANVLLNADLEPVLGDFGLVRLIGHDRIVTMTAAGTPGYIAPEVPFMGKATDRADVYSFGVLALEVACGRRVLDYKSQSRELMLVEWVWFLQENNELMEAMDSRMVESTDEWNKEMEDRWRCVLHVGLICCHPLPEARPRMSQVHQALKEVRIIPLPASRPDFPYSNTHR